MPLPSATVRSLPSSGIRQVFDQVTALERRGESVLRFDVGRPDVKTPHFLVSAAKDALDAGCTDYTANRGAAGLLESIAEKLKRENGGDYDAATEIVVTTGASEAVAAAIAAVLEPGAEALIPEPAWPHYAMCARLVGGVPVPVPLCVDDGFAVRSDQLARHVSKRTRLLVLNSPCNPTGQVYDRATLEDILQFARQHDLYVLADEMYEYFAYDGRPTSFASLPDAKEHLILVNGFSKAFGMTGWRLGYVAGPGNLIAEINKVHQYQTVCANSFAQQGAIQAYRHAQSSDFVTATVDQFRLRQQAILSEVDRARGMRYSHPAGAFYFFPQLPPSAPGSLESAMWLLREAKVAVVPGQVFGAAFDRFLRVSYGTSSLADVREGMRRIVDLLYR